MIRPVRICRQLVPGVWGDRRGAIHLDVPARLLLDGIDDTAVNRRLWAARMLTELRADLPRVVLVAHLEGLATQ